MKAKKDKRRRSEQMHQVSAGLSDVLGMTQWRKEHPQATWAEIEAAVDEQINPLRAQLLEDLVGARRTNPLPPNDGRRSGQAEAHLWHVSDLWGRLFSPSMSSWACWRAG